MEFDRIHRPDIHFVFVEKRGPFAQVAPQAWQELEPFRAALAPLQAEVLGLSGMSVISGPPTPVYQAGLSLREKPAALPEGMRYRHIHGGGYARFLVVGPYAQLATAFQTAFRTLAAEDVMLRPEFCIERYLNDPQTTPAEALETEILFPIA